MEVVWIVVGVILGTPAAYFAGVIACASCFRPGNAPWYWPLWSTTEGERKDT